MVTYQRWTQLIFELNPDAEATLVVSKAAEYWRENKELISGATVSEARELAKQVS